MCVTDIGLRNLVSLSLKQLKLVLNGCINITDSAMQIFTGIPLIKLELNLCTTFTGSQIDSLPSTLQSLYLGDCTAITDTDYSSLVSLTLLHLNGCPLITNITLCSLWNCPLVDLSVSECVLISDVGLQLLTTGKCMNTLESLNVSGCVGITDTGVGFMGRFPLKKVFISGCNQISNNGIWQLRHLSLESLDVSKCSQLTHVSLSHLYENSRMHLSHLDVSQCDWVNNEAILIICELQPRNLFLYGCIQFDWVGVGIMCLLLKQCSTIGLSDCTQLSQSQLDRLRTDLPDTTIVL